MSATEGLYGRVLACSQRILRRYSEIRQQYPDKDPLGGKACTAACVWCGQGKRDGFTEEDLKTTGSLWCHYCITVDIHLPDASGLEPSLRGEYLTDMLALNQYILTTASTNDPSDPMFQAMFVTFYTTPEWAEQIRQWCETLDYNYITYHPKTRQIQYKSEEGLIGEDIQDHKTNGHLGDYHGTFGVELDAFITSELILMTVEDRQPSRRTLYKVLLAYLTSAAVQKCRE